MSNKERNSKANFVAVRQKRLSLVECAKVLGISYRQAKHSYKRYKEHGDISLCYKSPGR